MMMRQRNGIEVKPDNMREEEQSARVEMRRSRILLSRTLSWSIKIGAIGLLALGLFAIWKLMEAHVQAIDQQEKIVILQEKLAMQASRMKFLRQELQQTQDQIRGFQAILRRERWTKTHWNESEEKKTYDKIVSYLRNKSGVGTMLVRPVAEPEPIQEGLAYSSMPHLMQHPKARCPAFQILSPRKSTDIDLVIGIPTVKREKESYLYDTVKSLIDGMTVQQIRRTLIIVSIGEANDLGYVVDTAYTLSMMFRKYFGQLIEVISPTKYWYPVWDKVPATLQDSQIRTHWRAKQNLDTIFLMSYAQRKGPYYLMMEDDAIARKGYITKIFKFVKNQTVHNPEWIMINFNHKGGGFGQLFKSEDLGFFNSYVQIFFGHMPIDWLLELYLSTRVCGFGKTSKMCTQAKNEIRPTYQEQLFDHAGLFSSLNGKMHKVKKDLRLGREIRKFYPHKNPPVARIFSTMQSTKHTIERAYMGQDFFQGYQPKVNDTIEFWFHPPIRLEKFNFRSGCLPELTSKIWHGSGVVEILPHQNLDQSEKTNRFIQVEEFDEFGNSIGKIDSKIGPVDAIRIRILKNIKSMIIINEIELVLVKTT